MTATRPVIADRQSLVERHGGVGLADDIGAQRLELLHEVRVAAIDVVQFAHGRDAIGDQTGQHEAGAGPDIGRLDGSTGKPFAAANYGVVPVGADLSSESHQLLDETEAPLE